MTPFHATADGYEAYWEEAERRVLAGVAREVAAMVRDQAGLPDRDERDDPFSALAPTTQTTGTPREPDDPAARRLLPDASRDDAEVSAEFRHLTQTDLAAGKVRGLELLADLLDGGDDEDAEKFADIVEAFERFGPFDDLDLPETGDGDDNKDDDEDDDGDRAVVVVDREDARAVAAALTDLRLVVGQRLGLEDDDDVGLLHEEVLADSVSPETSGGLDPEVRRYWGGIFVAAGFAQESLVSAMLQELRGRRG